MKEVEKIVSEVVASFRMENMNIPADVIYSSIKRLEIIFSNNNDKGKTLVKKVSK